MKAKLLNPVNNLVPQNNMGPKYGKDSVQCLMNLSLYSESFQQWRHSHYKNAAVKDAIGPWDWVFKNCPRSTEAIYVDGEKIMKYRINNAPANQKKALIDTLMMVFDQRLKYFPDNYRTHLPQEGYVLGRKGIALYQVSPGSYEKAYNILKKSVELDKNKATPAVMAYYFRFAARMVQAGKLDTLSLINTYNTISDYINTDIKNYTAQNNIRRATEYKNAILTKVYGKKYNASPNDSVLLKKIISMLEEKNCYNTPLYYNALVSMYKIKPNPQSAFTIGKILLQRKKYNQALSYLNKCTTMKDFPRARAMALKAIKLDPHNGTAYELIGDLYAASAPRCGKNVLTKKAVYWAAVDQYIKAKRVDPEMADAMNKKIAVYRANFPTRETLFFYNIKPGQRYKIGCWINVTTIARPSK